MERLGKTEFAPEMESELAPLVKRHHTTLYKVCRSCYPDDIYQMNALYNNIVYNLWQGYGQLRNKAREKEWVYKVAVNTAASSEREEKRNLETIPITQEMVEGLAERENDLLLEKMYAMIEQLETTEKMVINRYLDGIPQAEIARFLSLSETYVSTMIGRIKLKLKKIKEKDI
ncbi:MAG: sigma-70 family RNA polymerase sigma factor [Bacteroidales bacterium]|nr:sigma-70 family RNA polymerase sigma factor [Bacteroidales bacterium]